ncbi:ATP-binding cassette domain-containing protein [Candidatus Soleaferrea massiliensis]|uniref:ABC transporter ATP-binding protein n=1 Tax=Candidatus Soleaferrea massiliensis TaxID=1470354 RepID=UPI00058EFC6B|nr:ABC-F family ATP-binding cassette domain-containing protein [Candidatus Soleaferrea massiliensis]
MIVQLEQVCKSYNGNLILENVDFKINEHDRIGLIGVNGAGKSTLLRILIGEEDEDSGTVSRAQNLRIGYLRQNSGLERDATIWEEMRSVFRELIELEHTLRALEKQMGEIGDHESAQYRQLSEEYARKQEYYEQNDGYLIDVRIKTILNGMGFDDKDRNTVINTLSGGEKTRLALSKLLLEQPDLLILDEPTNHLDFKTLLWLEEYLKTYKGALLVVSHDRYFLDKLVDICCEIERHRLYTYKGNYTRYLDLKEEMLSHWQKEYEIQQQTIQSMQTYVEKNIARASTSQSAKSRLRALEKMDVIEKPPARPKVPHFTFSVNQRPPFDLLEVDRLCLTVGEGNTQKELLDKATFDAKRGEKVAFIGANGIGKSSLLKALLGRIPHQGGRIVWARNVKCSFYDQEGQSLHPDNTVFDEMRRRFPQLLDLEIRKALGGVLISGENIYKKVSVISGGERAKLMFAILMLEESNVLVMDEPTNHLDLPSKEVLDKALSEYEGTVLLVSHDRYLLNKIPDRIIELDDKGVRLYGGNFDFYLAQKKLEEEQAVQTEREEKREKGKTSGYRSREQKRLEVQQRQKLRTLETQIDAAEAQIRELEQSIADPANAADYELLQQNCSMLQELRSQLSDLMDEWVLLQEEA